VTYSGGRSHFSDSAPVPKFLNPGPAILRTWESDYCSDSGYNNRSNGNLPRFLLRKLPHRFLLLSKLKSDSGSGSGFFQVFDSGPGPKENRRINSKSILHTNKQSLFWILKLTFMIQVVLSAVPY